ncbi:MAG TPA: signal peptidase II [Gemmatimonadaceae bacterium]|nr:signal peptidase II [Gemmatimonadaceae bacterium]
MERSNRNGRLFWSVAAAFLLTDVVTKWWAVRSLAPAYTRHEVLGEWLTFTLLYNPGAAFGLHLGEWSRWIFTALTIGAVVILTRMYQSTAPGDTVKLTSLGMILGGAVGNLIDRLRSSQGVVDFIDVGIGDMRWPTFNVADIGVSCGALVLAWVLWREDRAAAQSVTASDPSSAR